ncbi:permease-like cell division protein FtsX [Euzebya rosea]|uniref:permease-like cell division protein FtsX n=1 Tax=Euzebya rosea TaxID=2052804 RepID=UPI000D3E1B57|nr:permease-like cell division protein FtsX [Euzebya rosea]
MASRWRYLIGEVGIGLRRNLVMTIATILTVTVTLTMVGTSLLVQRQIDLAQRVLYADVEVSIFLTDTITPEQQAALESDLRDQAVVAEVLYESKEQAFANAQEIFADDPLILDGLTADVLPASFRVKLTDPEEFAVISSLFTGRPGIEDIRDQSEILDGFFTVMGKIRGFAIALAVVNAIAAVLLVATTIRLTAFARREQIGIMKLVGASNTYIRLPFVLEGVAASFIGASLANRLLRVGMAFYLPDLKAEVAFLPFIDAGDVLAIYPLMAIAAVLVGAVTSVVAIHRFLSV